MRMLRKLLSNKEIQEKKESGQFDSQLSSYSGQAVIPQGMSPLGLENWLSINHPEYSMSSWCFYGNLIDKNGKVAAMSTIVQQQQDFPKSTPYIAEWSFCDQDTNGYIVIPYELASPSQVSYGAPFQIGIDLFGAIDKLSIKLISGNMGEANARYQLSGFDLAFNLDSWGYDLILKDTFGTIQVGYGPQSFLPQYLSQEQHNSIVNQYNNCIKTYLENTNDPMTGQGSYYYSLPLLEVETFTIKKNGAVYMEGNAGNIWVDYVVQGFTEQILSKLSKASWQFFAIQFPQSMNDLSINAGLMISLVQADTEKPWEDVNTAGFYYTYDNRTEPNGSVTPKIQWPADKIEFTVIKKWKEFPVEFEIKLYSGEEVSMIHAIANCENQLIPVVNKYEGVFNVSASIKTGDFDLKDLKGFAWAEVH